MNIRNADLFQHLAKNHNITLVESELDDIVYIATQDLQKKLDKILEWAKAYPLDLFPEPDLKKAAEVLKANDMSLNAISAHAMRHVLSAIEKLINEE